MHFRQIAVEAHAGYKYGEYPTAFTLEERRVRVVTVVDRWYEGTPEPGRAYQNYFKVLGDDGRQYLLRYNGLFDVWSLMERD